MYTVGPCIDIFTVGKLYILPRYSLLTLYTWYAYLTRKQLNVIAFASLIARRRILLQWKAASPPSAKVWLIDLMSFLKLEKIKFTIRGSTDKFYDYWQPLIAYVNSLQSLSPDWKRVRWCVLVVRISCGTNVVKYMAITGSRFTC